MAIIPDRESVYGAGTIAPKSQRQVVGYDANVIDRANIKSGQGLEGAGNNLTRFGEQQLQEQIRDERYADKQREKEKKEQERLERRQSVLDKARYRASVMQTKLGLEADFSQRDDYENFDKDIDSAFKNLDDSYKGTFKDEIDRGEVSLLNSSTKDLLKIKTRSSAMDKYKTQTTVDTELRISSLGDALSRAQDPEDAREIVETMNALVDNGTPSWSDSKRALQKNKINKSSAYAIVRTLPIEERLGLINKSLSGDGEVTNIKHDFIAFMLGDLEGGDAVVPEPNGGFAQHGINSKHHPEYAEKIINGELTYNEAVQITADLYWKGAEKYPVNLQPIAVDMKFNGWDKKVLNLTKDQAIKKANGDPAKLLEMRREYYDTLYKGNPAKWGKYIVGWHKRLDKLENFLGSTSVTGTPVDFLNKTDVERLERDTVAELKDHITSLDIDDLSVVVTGGNFNSLNEKQSGEIIDFAQNQLNRKLTHAKNADSVRAISSVSNLYELLGDGTLTQADINNTKEGYKDNPKVLNLIDNIEKQAFLSRVIGKATKKEQLKASEVVLGLEKEISGFGSYNKKGDYKNTGDQESATDFFTALESINKAVEAGVLKPKKGAEMMIAVKDGLQHLMESPRSRWYGETDIGEAIRLDPNIDLFSTMSNQFISANPALGNNNEIVIKLFQNAFSAKESAPEDLQGKDLINWSLEQSIRSTFPELSGNKPLPNKFIFKNGAVLNIPWVVSAEKNNLPKPDKVIKNEDYVVLNSYERIDGKGGSLSKEDVLRLSESSNKNPKELIDFWRSNGVIK